MTRVYSCNSALSIFFKLHENEVITAMQSIGTAACLRRSLRATSKSLVSCLETGLVARQCLMTSQRARHHRARPSRYNNIGRAFSTSTPRRFADVDDTFDPKSVDRESDQVDVCIVGGGGFLSIQYYPKSDLYRPCWT